MTRMVSIRLVAQTPRCLALPKRAGPAPTEGCADAVAANRLENASRLGFPALPAFPHVDASLATGNDARVRNGQHFAEVAARGVSLCLGSSTPSRETGSSDLLPAGTLHHRRKGKRNFSKAIASGASLAFLQSIRDEGRVLASVCKPSFKEKVSLWPRSSSAKFPSDGAISPA